MARASSRNMSSTLRPLRDAWDGSGRLRRDTGFGGAYTQSKAQEAKDLLEIGARRSKGEPIDAVKIPLAARQRSSSAAVSQGLAPANTSPSTTNPGTVSPSQPQRQAPGVRNFDLFGGVYTWSAAQQTKDEDAMRAGRTKNGLSDAVVRQPTAQQPAAGAAGKPAAGSAASWNSESYELAAMELAASGAGSKVFAGPAAKAAGSLTRTDLSRPVVESLGIMRDTAFSAGYEGAQRAASAKLVMTPDRPFDSRPANPWDKTPSVVAPAWDRTPEGVDVSFPDIDMSPYQTATRQERTDNERLFNTDIGNWMRRAVPGVNYARYTSDR